MGLDATIFAEGPELDEQRLVEVEAALWERLDGYIGHHRPCLVREYHPVKDDQWGYEIHTSSRYYSSAGGRGNWPSIRAAIVALRELLPEHTVLYGSADPGAPMWVADDDHLAEIDACWQANGRDGHP